MSAATKQNQLGRNAAVYGGALLLPRLAAFVVLVVFSRLLVPAEYGYFALLLISAELIDTVLFNWVRLALMRLYPEYEVKGRLFILRRTCLALTILASCVSVPLAIIMALAAAPDRLTSFVALLSCITFANGAVRLRLAELLTQQRSLRYFMIEFTRASLALVLSLILVELIGPHFEALGGGFAIA